MIIMCPDKKVLSAYIDNELNGSARNSVESHLAGCSSCAGVVASYKAVHEALNADTVPIPSFFDTRLFEKLKDAGSRRSPGVWRRKIFVPLPVAAFAMFLIMVLALGITLVAVRRPEGNVIAVNQQEAIPVKLTITDLAELSKILESDNYVLEVDMQLPKDHNFSIVGEPVLIRGNTSRAYDLRP